MATTRELSTINTSGELAAINLGGVTQNDKLLTKAEIQAVVHQLLGLDIQNNVLASEHDIKLLHAQVIDPDPVVVAADNRLITVANAFAIELALKQYTDTHFMPVLDEHNPSMRMDVSPTGLAAQMSVHDVEKSRTVATMEWLKSTQTFSFALMDRDTGVVKNALDMYLDGTAKLHGKNILTEAKATMLPTYTATGDHDLLTIKDLRDFRSSVVAPIAGSNPTKAECSTAAQTLPHWDWAKDDDFYIKDNNGSKYFLIKYRANGDTAVGGTNYKFYYEKLTEAS